LRRSRAGARASGGQVRGSRSFASSREPWTPACLPRAACSRRLRGRRGDGPYGDGGGDGLVGAAGVMFFMVRQAWTPAFAGVTALMGMAGSTVSLGRRGIRAAANLSD
jgi:hypothetical protein